MAQSPRKPERRAGVTQQEAVARMRSSIVSINGADPAQPYGSGVVVRGRRDDDGIVATALHVVREVPAGEDLRVGFPVPPSEDVRGGVTVVGATVVATDEGNDLALLEMVDTAPLTHGVPHPSGGRYPVTVAELEAERPADGEDVMISGFPLGYRYLLNSSGIIASAWGDQAIHEPFEGGDEGVPVEQSLDRYLVDINVNPGNSGGPCYRVSDQRVLGICEALQLVEVAFEEPAAGAHHDAALTVDAAHHAVMQKADITFVVPARYVIALLETQ